MNTKDYFSGHSGLYAAFRPAYPRELYDAIFSRVKNYSTAWDCATGNGQVASHLADHFEKVYATDISQNQLANAIQKDNIIYAASPAEKTIFQDNQFDLITVAQALHWFNTEEFYKEAHRVAKPDATIAVCGYALCTVNSEIDTLFLEYYNDIVGPYWDSARKLVEQKYASIAFPFDNVITIEIPMILHWSLDQFVGYLSTWSATQKYIQTNGANPIPELHEKLKPLWSERHQKPVTFPIFLKTGTVKK